MFTKTHAAVIGLFACYVSPVAFATTVFGTSHYPKYAFDHCLEGTVLVSYIVGEDLKPTEVTIISAEPEGVFEEATLKVVSKIHEEDLPGTKKEHKVHWEIDGCVPGESEET